MTTQRSRLPPASAKTHRLDGPKANNALVIKLDRLDGADEDVATFNTLSNSLDHGSWFINNTYHSILVWKWLIHRFRAIACDYGITGFELFKGRNV